MLCAVAVWAVVVTVGALTHTQKEDPAYAGLPPFPDLSGMRASPMRDMLMVMSTAKSDCWHFNHWIRVTLPPFIRELDRVAMDPAPAKRKLKDILQRAANSAEDLRRCPASAWAEVTMPDGKVERVNIHQRFLAGISETRASLDQLLN